MNDKQNNIMIYEDKDGVTKVSVNFIDEDIWLTQNQISEIYKTSQQDISTHKKFLLVQKEGNRNVKRNIDH